jgi:histidyl-tRNA synthetase
MPAIASVRGANDILPAQMPAWEWLGQTHREVASEFGYRGLETPIFEFTEMFERGIGAGTDVVDKEMYSFVDKGGDALTLRPENTPAAVRAVLGAHLEQEIKPVRVHYGGPMFRRDKPQRGRYRQFHQVGIEAIGEGSPALDAEIIEVGWRFFARLGISGVSLQINTLGDIEDRKRYRSALVDYYTPLQNQMCEDCQRRLQINPLRLLDCKKDARFVEAAPLLGDHLGSGSAEFFEQVVQGLDAASIPYHRNPRLVRGLDYYAHTTFEWWHTSFEGAQNALGGGGRYDGLAEVLGFPATPGAGYALGCERVLIIATEAGVAPSSAAAADVVVCPLSAAENRYAADVAREIRGPRIKVILDASSRKLDRKLRDADRQGARFAAIVGSNEVADGVVSLRDMSDKSSRTIPKHELAAAVTNSPAGAPS